MNFTSSMYVYMWILPTYHIVLYRQERARERWASSMYMLFLFLIIYVQYDLDIKPMFAMSYMNTALALLFCSVDIFGRVMIFFIFCFFADEHVSLSLARREGRVSASARIEDALKNRKKESPVMRRRQMCRRIDDMYVCICCLLYAAPYMLLLLYARYILLYICFYSVLAALLLNRWTDQMIGQYLINNIKGFY